MSETAPRPNGPENDQDFVPLNLEPAEETNELPVSPLGEGIKNFTESMNRRTTAAAERIDNLSRRSVKRRNDAGEWVADKKEQAKERTKAVFKKIGRGALKGLKATGRAAAFVPLTGIALGVKAGEAGVSMAKSGAGAVKSAGEAVSTKATETKNTTTEFVGQQTEKGKDNLANTRDKVGIGLGKLSLSSIDLILSRRDREVEKATRKREEAEAKEQAAIAKREKILAARNDRIAEAVAAQERIDTRRAKWNIPVAETAAAEVVDDEAA